MEKWYSPTVRVRYEDGKRVFKPVVRIHNDENNATELRVLNETKDSRQKAITFAKHYIKKLEGKK